MSRVTSKLSSVTANSVGGVAIKKHVLELEASSFAWITRKIGRRLHRWLKATPDEIQGHMSKWEEGRLVTYPMLHADGSPVMVPCIPDQDFRETYRWYSSSVTNLLREQRERAKMGPKNGGPALSDEDFEKGLQDLVAHAIRTMPETQLRELLQERAKMGAPIDVEVK